MNITVKIGGHLLDKGAEPFRDYATQIGKLIAEGHKVAVVVGGGERARDWINVARKLGGSEAVLDEIGILASRLNAYVQIQPLSGKVYPRPPESLAEFDLAWSTGRSVIMGGLTPGQSTTAVAAILAERTLASRLIILTNVDGVYTKKPGTPGANLLKKVNIEELTHIVAGNPALAGTYDLLDSVAVKILHRARIPTFVVNGLKRNIIIDAASSNRGTEIVYT